MTDPNRMAEREKKFGKSILKESKNPKDPELMKKRAEKFGKVIAAGASAGDDDARKKVILRSRLLIMQATAAVSWCCSLVVAAIVCMCVRLQRPLANSAVPQGHMLIYLHNGRRPRTHNSIVLPCKCLVIL